VVVLDGERPVPEVAAAVLAEVRRLEVGAARRRRR
jgi:hypothetical protein